MAASSVAGYDSRTRSVSARTSVSASTRAITEQDPSAAVSERTSAPNAISGNSTDPPVAVTSSVQASSPPSIRRAVVTSGRPDSSSMTGSGGAPSTSQ